MNNVSKTFFFKFYIKIVNNIRATIYQIAIPLVYVEWSKKWSRVNFVTIFGDLYKIKLWGICNNFNQFAHLSSASDPSNDVIKMAAMA